MWVGFGVGFLRLVVYGVLAVDCNFFGWVYALVTRTRHLHKFVRGGDNRRGGRLRPRFFRGKGDGRVPGRPPV